MGRGGGGGLFLNFFKKNPFFLLMASLSCVFNQISMNVDFFEALSPYLYLTRTSNPPVKNHGHMMYGFSSAWPDQHLLLIDRFHMRERGRWPNSGTKRAAPFSFTFRDKRLVDNGHLTMEWDANTVQILNRFCFHYIITFKKCETCLHLVM